MQYCRREPRLLQRLALVVAMVVVWIASVHTVATQAAAQSHNQPANPPESGGIEGGQRCVPAAGDECATEDAPAAPRDVPLPVAESQWLKKYPPSGSGLRVDVDDRHWIEFIAVGTIANDPVLWRPDGTLIDPPRGFDPVSLVPNKRGRSLSLEADRQALLQVVVPDSAKVTLRASGAGSIGKREYPIDGGFKQVVFQRFSQGIQGNFAYVKVGLMESDYRWIQFDNVSIYPGPKSAVRILVDGNPVAEKATLPDQPAPSPDEVRITLASEAPQQARTGLAMVPLRGRVVDANNEPKPNAWVGMFEEAEESAGYFRPRYRLAAQTWTEEDGAFFMSAPRKRDWFDGVFWTIDDDGRSGMKPFHAVWSHVEKNLTIGTSDEEGQIKVINPDGNPVAGAEVTTEYLRLPRGVVYEIPADVSAQLKSVTDERGIVKLRGWPAEAIRGVAVATERYGTQFLSSRRASQWVSEGEPLILQLKHTGSIIGRIVDFASHSSQEVKLLASTSSRRAGPLPPLDGRAVARVQKDGSFRIDKLAEGPVVWESSLDPTSLWKLDLPPTQRLQANGELKVELAMVPATLVRQRIIKSDTGEGISDMELRVLWGDAVEGASDSWSQSIALRTDKNGWWAAPVLPGKINIRISSVPEGYEGTAWFDGRNGYLGVEATVPRSERVVTLAPEAYVPAKKMNGTLLYADDAPAAGWMVYGHPISWQDVGVGGVRTKQDGTFTWTYPTGYPPRLFEASNREWLTEHHFEDNKVRPRVESRDPLILRLPKAE